MMSSPKPDEESKHSKVTSSSIDINGFIGPFTRNVSGLVRNFCSRLKSVFLSRLLEPTRNRLRHHKDYLRNYLRP